MDISIVARALGALSQQTRLRAFRLLMRSGPDGMAASDIASELGVRQNLMSTHLMALSNAGLTTVRRDGRYIYHAIDFEATRTLLHYLVADCCNGCPSKCKNLLDEVLPLTACESADAV